MLSESKIKAALPKQRPDETWKTVLLLDSQGLYAQVSMGTSGVNRSFVYRYSVAGKSTIVGLGRFPDVSLADARKAADVQRGLRASGLDPLLEKRRAREELIAQRAALNAKEARAHEVRGSCGDLYRDAPRRLMFW
jgi:hypothetical protein